jgi:hypothetical protein
MRWNIMKTYVKNIGKLLGITTNNQKKLNHWKTEEISSYTYPNEQIENVLLELENRKIRALEYIRRLQNR